MNCALAHDDVPDPSVADRPPLRIAPRRHPVDDPSPISPNPAAPIEEPKHPESPVEEPDEEEPADT